jgi:hypothetical protein
MRRRTTDEVCITNSTIGPPAEACAPPTGQLELIGTTRDAGKDFDEKHHQSIATVQRARNLARASKAA